MEKYTKYILGVASLLIIIISSPVLASETKIPKLPSSLNINLHKLNINKINNRFDGIITSIDTNGYTISTTKKDGTIANTILKTDTKTKIIVQKPRPTRVVRHLTSNNKPLTTNKIVETPTLKVGDTVRVTTKSNPDGSLLALSINQRPALRIKK